MPNNYTFLEKLELQIDELCPIVDELLDNSAIYYRDLNRDSSIIRLGSPLYHWGQKDEKTQIKAKQKYNRFLEDIELLLDKANPSTINKTQATEKRIIELIGQTRGAPPSIEAGKSFIRKEIQIYKEFLKLFKKEVVTNILIPDTNALIEYPDPTSYRNLTDVGFSFLILPTVLSELDKLKINHRNEGVRDKAKSIIKRLKGYRQQGNVLEGVLVDKNIIVKMLATEPNFEKTLSWLDQNNEDDRIIANVLDVQIQNPSDRVVLITSDINLQNKAQLANLTFADTDDFE